MEQAIERIGLKRNGALRFKAILLTGSLAVLGCDGGDDNIESSPIVLQAPTTIETQVNPSAASENASLVFDDHYDGSVVIQVYPGVTSSDADKQYNGTFNDGDTVQAECKTVGRSVSDPSVGEDGLTSSEWIRIQGSPGEVQYATAVYVENPEELLKELPDC